METTFVGISISSRRRPFSFAALDQNLNPLVLGDSDLEGAIEFLSGYQAVLLAVNVSLGKSKAIKGKTSQMDAEFHKQLAKMKFVEYPARDIQHQWLGTDSNECFRQLIGNAPRSKLTLEGRLQRALILYEHKVRINDPMEFFDEITRHRLMEGSLPTELLYSPESLDALAAAYVAWLVVNESDRIEVAGDRHRGKIVISKTEEKE